jgi:hypothetical protein
LEVLQVEVQVVKAVLAAHLLVCFGTHFPSVYQDEMHCGVIESVL